MEEWKDVKYMIFDAPLVPGPFSDRLKVCKQVLDKNSNSTVQMISQTTCKNAEHLETLMDNITDEKVKGEGVMIKDPASVYERKRSYALLKVKRFDDAEAEVIGHVKGTGRLHASCGAI